MLAQFTGVFSAAGINIETMVNRSRGNYAYTVLDICAKATAELVNKVNAIEGVLKARAISKKRIKMRERLQAEQKK